MPFGRACRRLAQLRERQERERWTRKRRPRHLLAVFFLYTFPSLCPFSLCACMRTKEKETREEKETGQEIDNRQNLSVGFISCTSLSILFPFLFLCCFYYLQHKEKEIWEQETSPIMSAKALIIIEMSRREKTDDDDSLFVVIVFLSSLFSLLCSTALWALLACRPKAWNMKKRTCTTERDRLINRRSFLRTHFSFLLLSLQAQGRKRREEEESETARTGIGRHFPSSSFLLLFLFPFEADPCPRPQRGKRE